METGLKKQSTYEFHIDSRTIAFMYQLMIEGNNDHFTENYTNFTGSERGGNFCYKKDNNNLTIKIDGLSQASLMPGTTSLNSGDFPFTFHTHPLVVNINEKIIDNYPNLISSEDLIGSIIDNFDYSHSEERNICNKVIKQNDGVNFFDIVAVPYGLYVYRPVPKYYSKKNNKSVVSDCRKIFNNSIPFSINYMLKNKKRYFDTTTHKSRRNISKYIDLLRNNGFLIDFFYWEDALHNGINFKNVLPVYSDLLDNVCICND